MTDFQIYSRIEKFVTWVQGSRTGGTLGSMVDRSACEHKGRDGAWLAHGAPGEAWRGGAGGGSLAGQARESRAGQGEGGGGSPRWNPRWRGDATGPETTMVAASRRWRCKRLGGEESEGEGVGNDGERRDPFIVAGRGTPW
jgi:hypothetical protein